MPVYAQLKTLLMEEILLGRYGPDDRLPTEHKLCELYDISRTPVTRALSELADDGVILRRRGVGTFVNPHWLRRTASDQQLRVVVQEGIWADLVKEVTPGGVDVSLVVLPFPELPLALKTAVAEGVAPDLAIIDSVRVPEFAESGFLIPLEELDETWVRLELATDFLKPMIQANRFAGRTFGAALYAGVSGLWCHRRELERRGLVAPSTWAQLRKTAQILADDGVTVPVAMTGGSKGGETTAWTLLGWLASNGTSALGPSGVEIDSPQTVQTLRFLRRLIDEGLMPPYVVGYPWDRPIQLLGEGHAAMSSGGSYDAPRLAAALGVELGDLRDHLDFVPIPAGPRGGRASVAGGTSCCIFRQARNPRVAMRLLESVVAPTALARPTRTAGRIPARRSAIALAEPYLPFAGETSAMFDYAVNQPSTPSYPRVSVQLQTMLEAVLSGRLSATAAARRAGETIAAITA